ncbi:MAG: hypothetical protein KGQ59_04730 [Bdellovibrionales bacterium]|nr:hypothetical protein [Bdellovibrionales bacterium]
MTKIWQKLDIFIALISIGAGGLFLLEMANPGILSRGGGWSLGHQGVAELVRDNGNLRLRESHSSVWRDFDERVTPVGHGDAIYTARQSEATLTLKEGAAFAKIGPESLVVVKRALATDGPSSRTSTIRLEMKRGKLRLEIPPSQTAQKTEIVVEVAGKLYEFRAPEKDKKVGSEASSPVVELKMIPQADKQEPVVQIQAESQEVQLKVRSLGGASEAAPVETFELKVGQTRSEKLSVDQVASLQADPVLESVRHTQTKVVQKAEPDAPRPSPVAFLGNREISSVEKTTIQSPKVKNEVVKQIQLPSTDSERREIRLGFSLELMMGQFGVTDQSTQLGGDFALKPSPALEALVELPLSERFSLYPEIRANLLRVTEPGAGVGLSADNVFLGDLLAGVGTSGNSRWRLKLSTGLSRKISFTQASSTMIQVAAVTMPVLQAQAKIPVSDSLQIGLKTKGLWAGTRTSSGGGVGYEQDLTLTYYSSDSRVWQGRRAQSRFFWGAGCALGKYSFENSGINTMDFSIRWGLD